MQSACRRCGRPGAAGDREGPCEFCRGRKQHFDRCIALWTYEGLVRQAVVSSKYGTQMALADALGVRLADRVRRELSIAAVGRGVSDHNEGEAVDCDAATNEVGGFPDIITPVPSHWLRRLHRGGGGCRIVAAAVHRSLRRLHRHCVYRDCLRVTRRIEKQAWLGEKERESNVRDAFRLARSLPLGGRPVRLARQRVLLIDDVMTTGATSNEIAKVLKAAGAGQVVVAVVARALGR